MKCEITTVMDQTTALRLLKNGAFFIFLDVPEGTEFGIDMKSWNTGERFRGVKMIPPGIHYIFYSAVSSTQDIAPRIGFFHNFKKGEIFVRKWDKQMEQMSSQIINEHEVVKIKENLAIFDGFLGPYPDDIFVKWKALSGKVTESTIENLTPLSGQIKSALELQSCTNEERPKGVKRKLDEITNFNEITSSLPDLKPIEGTALRMTSFPEKNYPEGASPSEITKHSLDLTYVFETVLKKYTSQMELISELQFMYICFLVGHSFEAFDQWKKIVTVFCSCDLAVTKYRKLFDEFITVLDVQIQEIPEAFLADIVTNDNFVYMNLRNFFRTVKCSNLDGQFKSKLDRFKTFLSSSYMWDFEDLDLEDDDEAPVIVQI